MNLTTADPAPLRRRVYTLLIVLAAAGAAARLLGAGLVYEPVLHRDARDPDDFRRNWPALRPNPMPTYSSNDRSRWATVRALVDEGTFAIGRRAPGLAGGLNEYGDRGIIFEDGWGSVDKVLDPRTNIFYSSKPPLLSVLAAGEYWLLKRVFGWTITGHPFTVVRTTLLTFNWLPFLVYLALLALFVERYGTTDWGRLYVVAAGAFGTLLTPFLNTFNNHTLSSCFALFALVPALDALADDDPTAGRRVPPGRYLLAGFCSGLAVAMEMPAAAFAAALGVLLAWRSPARTLTAFLPALVVPLAAYFGTNYWAVGQFQPVQSEFGSPWYVYEGSHWKTEPGQVRRGIDFADEPKAVYAFHLLFGHHGVFSLTPVFLLSAVAVAVGVGHCLGRRGSDFWGRPERDEKGVVRSRPFPTVLFPLTLFLSVVVIGFYIVKTNNYGGWTCGPRWLMWLTPFWLLTLLPVADRLAGRRWGRVLAYACLGVSVLSASYPAVNPWRHPWLFQFLESQGWIQY